MDVVGLHYDPSTSIGAVRRLIGDRATPYHFGDDEITEFLTEASSCKYGAAGLALLAWHAELSREYQSVSAGNVSRSVQDLNHMLKDAERYIKMSDDVTLDVNDTPSIGTARVDYESSLSTRREKLRNFAEEQES